RPAHRVPIHRPADDEPSRREAQTAAADEGKGDRQHRGTEPRDRRRDELPFPLLGLVAHWGGLACSRPSSELRASSRWRSARSCSDTTRLIARAMTYPRANPAAAASMNPTTAPAQLTS